MAYVLLETIPDKLLLEGGAGGILLDENATALMSSLFDNFDDNSTNATLWNINVGPTIAETSQQLQITTKTASPGVFGGYESVAAYNLDENFLMVQLVSAGNQALASQDAIFYCEVDSSGANQHYMYVETNLLFLRRRVATVADTVSVAFNSTTMKWLRIRMSGGVVFMETSPDGLSWTTQRQYSNPHSTTSYLASMDAGTRASESSTGTVIFDNFNIVPTLATQQLTLLGVG